MKGHISLLDKASVCRRGWGIVIGGVAGKLPALSLQSIWLQSMSSQRSNDPLHGVTLERLLTELVAHFGWGELGERIDIRCFRFEPSIKSSLVFLRKTPWARTKVEELYVRWKHTDAGSTTGRDH